MQPGTNPSGCPEAFDGARTTAWFFIGSFLNKTIRTF